MKCSFHRNLIYLESIIAACFKARNPESLTLDSSWYKRNVDANVVNLNLNLNLCEKKARKTDRALSEIYYL